MNKTEKLVEPRDRETRLVEFYKGWIDPLSKENKKLREALVAELDLYNNEDLDEWLIDNGYED